MMDLPDAEIVCPKVHAALVQAKINRGITSEKNAKGEEMMVTYAGLSTYGKEQVQELVGIVYVAIRDSANAEKS